MTDVAQILGMGENKRGHASASSGNAPSSEPTPPPPTPASYQQPSRALQKLHGKSREIMGLLNDSHQTDPNSVPLPPSVPTFQLKKEKLLASPNEEGAVKVGNRWIRIQNPARKWAWAPFSSSSRTDGTLFHHWVRSNVEYPDYPYARFDIHLDPIAYSDEEYQKYLVSDTWTKSETDRLLELARRHEMRWPVIFDRWIELFCLDKQSGAGNDPPKTERKIEDLQFRFYQVAAVLNQVAIKLEASTEAQMLAATTPDAAGGEDPKATTEQLLYDTAAARQLAAMEGSQQPLIAVPGSGTSNKVFDLEHERQRRLYMEALWNRTKEEENEERELRKELKQIEAQLRKMKKSGAHIMAARKIASASASGAAATGNSASSSRNNSRSVSPVPEHSAIMTGASSSSTNTATGASAAPPFAAIVDEAFTSTAPVPVPGTPYLQSGRLVPPAVGGSTGLNKSLLTRMDTFLRELKVPERPLPTKRVCDMYDSVRKDVLSLLLLLKNVLQKEGLVQSKRLKLGRLTGDIRMTEESVMGLSPSTQSQSAGASGSNPTNTAGTGARPKAKASTKGGGGKTAPTSASATSGGGTKSKGAGSAKQKAAASDEKLDPTSKDVAASATFVGGGGSTAAPPAAGAKQGVARPVGGGKQAVGGKQANKKAAPKRKRKSENISKSPVPAPSATGAAAPPLTDNTVEPPPSVTAAVQQHPTEQAEPPKSSGKKRPRKAGNPTT
ncbi:hypothetical protein ACA910_003085 [Epithemia clementina (nom. ined.)]